MLEELQSDWHQRGRDLGYDSPEAQARKVELEAKRDELRAEREALRDRLRADRTKRTDPEGWPEVRELNAQLEQIGHELSRPHVPDAPFKRTEDWVALSFRRALQEAAEGGYDRIAWVSGEQAADMYDLRKQVSRIEWDEASGELTAYDHAGRDVIHESGVDANRLPEFVGKEPAERLQEAASDPMRPGDRVSIEGDDLAVGGTGMDTFYNRIVPNVVKKEAKRLGVEIEPVRIGETTVPPSNHDSREAQRLGISLDEYRQQKRAAAAEGEPTNLSIRLTPAAREKILNEGQRLGAMPVEGATGITGAGVGATAGAASAEEGEEGRGAAIGGAIGGALGFATPAIFRHLVDQGQAGHLINPLPHTNTPPVRQPPRFDELAGPKGPRLQDLEGAPAAIRAASERPLFDTNPAALERGFIEDVEQTAIDMRSPAKGKRLEAIRRRFTPAKRRALIERANEIRDQIPAAQFWYATAALRERYIAELGEAEGIDAFNQFMARVAATSPRNPVYRNVVDASRNEARLPNAQGLLAQVNRGEPMGTPSGIGAPKARSFDQNLVGNLRPTTFDVHMTNVIGGRRAPPPSADVYAEYDRLFSVLAEEAGMPEAMLQSTLWHDGPTLVDPAPFLEMVDRAVTAAAGRQSIPKEEALRRFIRGEEALGAAVLGLLGAEIARHEEGPPSSR